MRVLVQFGSLAIRDNNTKNTRK